MQVKTPNRLKLLRQKVMVVSVKEKVGGTDQVWIKETNAREPLKTCRTLLDDVETGGWDVQSGYVWEATCIMPGWHPAWRRRELDSGSWVERVIGSAIIKFLMNAFARKLPHQPLLLGEECKPIIIRDAVGAVHFVPQGKLSTFCTNVPYVLDSNFLQLALVALSPVPLAIPSPISIHDADKGPFSLL